MHTTPTSTPSNPNTPSPLGLQPSFGFGDRLGLATPGHLAALRAVAPGRIRGIFAQQSIREMARTRRVPGQVMRAAQTALDAAGFTDPWGADADHLKTPDDVNLTASAGFCFFTIDPSAHVDPHADDYPPDQLDAAFAKVADECPWVDDYVGKTLAVPDGPRIAFDAQTVRRAAVKYGRAIRHTLELAAYIDLALGMKGRDYEIELSVDETPQPTTPAEHYIIARQCRTARHPGDKLVSLAPRFLGELEKGVDYRPATTLGLSTLEASLADHAAIARHLGPYKLSLHSGSDKLAMYTPFARATRGLFHVKTAGTSYLEALRVVARHAPDLFRRIIDFSRERYDTDKATYHVSATLDSAPPPSAVADNAELERLYLEHWADVPPGRGFTRPGRQVLHCTFGSVLTHPTLGGEVRSVLESHPDTYTQVLCEHFTRHLESLAAGM